MGLERWSSEQSPHPCNSVPCFHNNHLLLCVTGRKRVTKKSTLLAVKHGPGGSSVHRQDSLSIILMKAKTSRESGSMLHVMMAYQSRTGIRCTSPGGGERQLTAYSSQILDLQSHQNAADSADDCQLCSAKLWDCPKSSCLPQQAQGSVLSTAWTGPERQLQHRRKNLMWGSGMELWLSERHLRNMTMHPQGISGFTFEDLHKLLI